MPLMSGGDAVVRSILGHGISTIYCLPGIQSDHLFNALFDVGDALNVIHTRHEQGAAYMALGAALATGKPQVYSVVPGPGLVAQAFQYMTSGRPQPVGLEIAPDILQARADIDPAAPLPPLAQQLDED